MAKLEQYMYEQRNKCLLKWNLVKKDGTHKGFLGPKLMSKAPFRTQKLDNLNLQIKTT